MLGVLEMGGRLLLIKGRDRDDLEGELAIEHLELCTTYHVFVEEDIVTVSFIQIHVVCGNITFVRSKLSCIAFRTYKFGFRVMLSTHHTN